MTFTDNPSSRITVRKKTHLRLSLSTRTTRKPGASSFAIIETTIPGKPPPEPTSNHTPSSGKVNKKSCAESTMCLLHRSETELFEIRFTEGFQRTTKSSKCSRAPNVSRETSSSGNPLKLPPEF